MKKITSIPEDDEAGAPVPDLSRRRRIAENRIYRWKSQFGGMEVSEARLHATCGFKNEQSTQDALALPARKNGCAPGATRRRSFRGSPAGRAGAGDAVQSRLAPACTCGYRSLHAVAGVVQW